MKRIVSLVVALIAFTSVFATTVADCSNVVYAQNINATIGNTVELPIYLKNTDYAVKSFQFNIELPDGISFVSVADGYQRSIVPSGWTSTAQTQNGQPSNTALIMGYYNSASDLSIAKGDTKVMTLSLMIANNAMPEVKNIVINDIRITDGNGKGHVLDNSVELTSTVSLQRAAEVQAQADGYSLKIIPFTLAAGETKDVVVYLNNVYDVDRLKFKVTYPTNVQAASKLNGKITTYTKPTVLPENLYSTEYNPTADADNQLTPLTGTVAQTDAGSFATYTIASTGDVFNATEGAYKPFLTIPVKGKSGLAAGVYTLIISEIEMNGVEYTGDEENPTIDHPISGGNFLASVFVGESYGDAILYGNYDDDAKAAALSALKGGSADITTTNLTDFAPNDVLVYGKTNTTYNRSVTGLGTVCVPIELTSDANTKYYTVSSTQNQDGKLVFTEAATVPANTPALVKGNIAASAAGYLYAATPIDVTESGWTMKGSYEKKQNITGVYYVANGKIWKAVTNPININPFRAYFEKSDGGSVKSFDIYIDDETGLHEVTNQLSEQDIYNLQGVKLDKVQKGINIINGKTVLVK